MGLWRSACGARGLVASLMHVRRLTSGRVVSALVKRGGLSQQAPTLQRVPTVSLPKGSQGISGPSKVVVVVILLH